LNRIAWTVVALLIVGALSAVFFARGSNKELMPYFGKWNGQFDTTDEAAGLRGYLQMYATGRRFVLDLQGPQQGIEVSGVWVEERTGQVVLSPNSITIDDWGGEEKRDPNKPYLSEDAVRSAFNRKIALSMSEDKKALEGLPMSIEGISGRLDFRR
jgi:hypothetical protein